MVKTLYEIPESQHLQVKDLYEIREDRLKREYGAYKQILDRIYKRIRNVEIRGGSDMIYDVPPFIMGMPLYSREYAVNYIIQSLSGGGFECYYMGESYIYVNWGSRKIKTEKGEIIKDPNRFGIPKKVKIKEKYKINQRKEREYEDLFPKPRMSNREKIKRSHNKKSEKIRDNPNQYGVQTADTLLRETIMRKPEFSLDALRKLHTRASMIGMDVR